MTFQRRLLWVAGIAFILLEAVFYGRLIDLDREYRLPICVGVTATILMRAWASWRMYGDGRERDACAAETTSQLEQMSFRLSQMSFRLSRRPRILWTQRRKTLVRPVH